MMSAPTATETRLTAGGAALERVSAREVRESAYRALRAAGASAGEAAAAAATVLEAEIQGWGGLHALLHEVETLPHVLAPVHSYDHDVVVVDDPARRGPLLLGRAVFDVATAHANRHTPVRAFAHGLGFHRALLCPALELAERARGVTVLAGVDDNATITCALACTSDGRIHVPADPAEFAQDVVTPARSGVTGRYGGVSLAAFSSHGTRHGECPVMSTLEQRAHQRAEAMCNGLNVPADIWAAVHRASRRFLVSESNDTPTDQG